MQSFKYFTKEGNVYTKIPQRGVFYTFAALLLAIAICVLVYEEVTKGTKILSAMLGILGLILLLRATASTKFDVTSRTITAQSFFFTAPRVFSFDDFHEFLVSKQTMLITINATANMVVLKNGKEKILQLHQTVFLTKPLQRVIDEAAEIMGLGQ